MLFEHLKQDFIDHAEEVFPEEMLGVVVDDEYVRLKNVDPEPEKFFQMSPADELKYGFADPEQGKKPQMIVHSHPDSPFEPSFADMKAQKAAEVPFGLIQHSAEHSWRYLEWGDHILDEPLIERPFIHGVMDCYEAIRAWYWQEKKIYLPGAPRRNFWWEPVFEDDDWENGEVIEEPLDLYAQCFEDWGFVQLTSEDDKQPGDVFFYCLNLRNRVQSPRSVENHGGVYLGGGEIYHHLPGRLSEVTAAEGWARKATRWVRYKGLD